MVRKTIIGDAILDFLFEGNFEGNTEKQRLWGCCNGVTVCPERNVSTCPDTVSLIKYVIASNVLQILFKGLWKSYNTILVTTSINEKAEEYKCWIHTHLIWRYR